MTIFKMLQSTICNTQFMRQIQYMKISNMFVPSSLYVSVDSCEPPICASSGGPGATKGISVDGIVRRLNVVESLDHKWKTIVKNEEIFLLFW